MQKRWFQVLVTYFSKKIFKKRKNFSKSLFSVKNKSILGILLTIFVAILFCLVCFVASDFVSSIITHEGSLLVSSKLEIPANTLYCVSICDFETEFDAKIASESVEKQGGMGEVYQDGEFFVICACYPTLIEAQEVRNNLCTEGNNARIVNFKIPELNFSYKGKNKKKIEQILRFPREIVLALYDLILQYDGGELPLGTLNANLAELYQKSRDFEENFAKIKTNLSKNDQNSIFKMLKFTTSIINNAILTKNDSNIKTSTLKKAMFKISEQNATLFASLNEK